MVAKAGGPVRVVVTLLVRVAWMVVVVLLVVLAVRVVAWAGRRDPMGPAAVVMSKMPQASATHADQVRTRMVPSLSFRGDKRSMPGPARGARGQEEGKRD